MNLLDGQADVLWSSPNFYFEGDPREIIPNDPSYGSQYHHPLMKNNLAWDITFGNPNIIIGITDDGVSTTHTDLAPNIWINTDEIAGNGIDDDANGYIDDVQGWDFSSITTIQTQIVPVMIMGHMWLEFQQHVLTMQLV